MKTMTEINWLKLSGLFHECLYNSENPQCPFNDYRKMDQIQQMQIISTISERKGLEMINLCNSCKHNCTLIPAKVFEIQNSNNFRIVG